jgi:hypothetical protein
MGTFPYCKDIYFEITMPKYFSCHGDKFLSLSFVRTMILQLLFSL